MPIFITGESNEATPYLFNMILHKSMYLRASMAFGLSIESKLSNAS